MKIKIADNYTKTPGGRFASEGKFSGEDFRNNYLKPAYIEAKEKNDVLEIDLDGGYGYATSFLEEAFGGLARELKENDILNIVIVSEEEPSLISKIHEYIEAGLKS